MHVVAVALAPVFAFVQTLNEWESLPLFVTVKTAGDAVILAGVTFSVVSCGEPTVTVTFAGESVDENVCASATGTATATTASTTSGTVKRERSIPGPPFRQPVLERRDGALVVGGIRRPAFPSSQDN